MVGYVRLLNKSLHLTVSQFCLKFLCPVVHNFTNYRLSQSEQYLLSLGLNFRPTASVISVNSRKKQLEVLFRSIRLKSFFHDMDSTDNSSHRCKLFVRSDWNPPICPPYIEIPFLAIRHEICSLTHSSFCKPNLSTIEFCTLGKLFANKNILILPSDKNLGTVIVTKKWYEMELTRLLSDEKFYEKVDAVPYLVICDKLNTILRRYGKLLEDRLTKYILHLTNSHSPAKFKMLPKVHKKPLVGRPIVASSSFITTPASKFIDYCLSPYLSSLPSYLRDFTQLINELANYNTTKDCYLVTADVTSLYTNIPITDCLVAIDLFCRDYGVPHVGLIVELSRLVLTNNYFEANGTLFHQIWGLAMGTPMAVSAAVIYMARLEHSIIQTRELILYKRFIDDIFFIWGGSYIELTTFLEKLNNLAPTIKLVSNISQERVVFLDMEIVMWVASISETNIEFSSNAKEVRFP